RPDVHSWTLPRWDGAQCLTDARAPSRRARSRSPPVRSPGSEGDALAGGRDVEPGAAQVWHEPAGGRTEVAVRLVVGSARRAFLARGRREARVIHAAAIHERLGALRCRPQ